jgi:hypothetical protein
MKKAANVADAGLILRSIAVSDEYSSDQLKGTTLEIS